MQDILQGVQLTTGVRLPSWHPMAGREGRADRHRDGDKK